MNITLIHEAGLKFGEVVAVRKSDKGLVFLIKRDDPASDDLPWMTIRGHVQATGKLIFEYGHYDLTEEQASADYAKR